MSEDKKSLIDLVPDSIDNVVKNITDKPSQNIGTTLADIWYLVFGGISQAAEKRKLKYSYALQEFEKELKDKITKIPEDKLVEPDMQTVAKALEAAKYCIEKDELRHMFAKLISSSLTVDISEKIHPVFVRTISSLNSIDSKLLYCSFNEINISLIKPSLIISSLEIMYRLGILKDKMSDIRGMDYNESIKILGDRKKLDKEKVVNIFYTNYIFRGLEPFHAFYNYIHTIYPEYMIITHHYDLSEFGSSFLAACIDKNIKIGNFEHWEIDGYSFSICIL